MTSTFYKAFEERFRGSRELIKSRLEIYKPFISPLSQAYPAGLVLDLGCGRGEWLELMQSFGFKAKGVDLDAGMLEACEALNLDVALGDALAYLHEQPDQSHAIVSAFHVVEHIQFEQLQGLVLQALRVLKPGGLLIMETPNPENILVATSSFYLDPSHERPIPSALLSFVAEHAGFHKVKVLGLQEPPELSEKVKINLQNVLKGVSPDYCVIAQKESYSIDALKSMDAFEQDHGLSLEVLVNRWDAHHSLLETECDRAQAQSRQALEQARQLQEETRQVYAQLQSMYASKSWRITAPLRFAMHLLRGRKK